MGAKWALLPKDADPAVYAALRAAYDSGRTWDNIEVRAGVTQDALRIMIYRNQNPKLGMLRKVLSELGFDLVVVPKT